MDRIDIFDAFVAVADGDPDIKLASRALIVPWTVYAWGHDGQRDRVWRWRRSGRWRRCGLIHRVWAWLWWVMTRAVKCRSCPSWVNPRYVKGLPASGVEEKD